MARSPSKIVFSFLSSPITLIGFGILLRTVQYAANPSLWVDESALALNIIQRTYADLFQPLDYGQAAPVGFLLLEKFVSLRLGIGEYALRLIPFLSGIASLFLFHALAKRCLVREAVPWALFLFAIASPLVYYSSELKQYSSDVCITLAILLAGIRAREKNLDLFSVAMFGAAGAVGIWFSQPACAFRRFRPPEPRLIRPAFREDSGHPRSVSDAGGYCFSQWPISVNLCCPFFFRKDSPRRAIL